MMVFGNFMRFGMRRAFKKLPISFFFFPPCVRAKKKLAKRKCFTGLLDGKLLLVDLLDSALA